MDEQILETWEIHSRVVLYVLDAVSPAALAATPPTGRSIGEMFAHIHNVRLMWLKASSAPDLPEGLAKVEKESAADQDALRQSLIASGQAIGTLLKGALEAGGKVKGFKPHAAAFLGYLISHESYHQGEIGMVLSQLGHALDKKVAYGMWEWGAR